MWASVYPSGSRTSMKSAPSASASANVSMSTSGASGGCSALMVTVLGRQHVGTPMKSPGPVHRPDGAHPLVQPVGPPLPELDRVRRDQVPAPVGRPGHVTIREL